MLAGIAQNHQTWLACSILEWRSSPFTPPLCLMPNLAPLLESEKLVMKCMGPKLWINGSSQKGAFYNGSDTEIYERRKIKIYIKLLSLGHKLGKIVLLMTGRIAILNYLLWHCQKYLKKIWACNNLFPLDFLKLLFLNYKVGARCITNH